MKYFENLYDCQHVKVHKTDSVWVSWLPSNAGEYYRGCAPPRYQLHEARGRRRRRTLFINSSDCNYQIRLCTRFFCSLSNEYGLGALSLMLVS
jgi:hypothetical protein